MKRRDVLKGVGALAVAAPAGRTFAYPAKSLAVSSTSKDLVVTFAGPFCFWLDSDSVKVMAPPVGPLYVPAPHTPWFGTSTNEKPVHGTPADYKLVIDGYQAPTTTPIPAGTRVFYYEQGQGKGAPPLFNLSVPVPNVVIGVRPTVAKMVCSPTNPDPYCKQWNSYASGLTFLYQNVDLQGVHILQGASEYFRPCFTNDEVLPAAGLGIHLTPVDRRADPSHGHAKKVWSQMLAMYPWMGQEITGIEFCPNFDPSACSFDPASCGTATHRSEAKVMIGPGDDCEVPGMLLGPIGSRAKRK
jgi:hypothetical protein